MSSNKSVLAKFIDKDERVTVFKPFILFMGSHEKAAFLNQLYYWTNGRTRIKGGWIAKSYLDWYEEIVVEKRPIMAATKLLKELGVLETKIKKFNNQNTLHYKFDMQKFDLLITEFIQNGCQKRKQKPRGVASHKSAKLNKGGTNLTNTKGSTNKASLGSTNLYLGGTNKALPLNNEYSITTKTEVKAKSTENQNNKFKDLPEPIRKLEEVKEKWSNWFLKESGKRTKEYLESKSYFKDGMHGNFKEEIDNFLGHNSDDQKITNSMPFDNSAKLIQWLKRAKQFNLERKQREQKLKSNSKYNNQNQAQTINIKRTDPTRKII